MHISSLPNPYGIGSVGKCAFDFVDFLHSAGQSYWQLLPLSPTGYGDSPYQAFSTFAGNHYFIDIDLLIGEGLLRLDEAFAPHWGSDPCRVDYGSLYENRAKLLHLAFERFEPSEDYYAFVGENAHWLEDYSLFMALKERYNGLCWQQWPEGLMRRDGAALEKARGELKSETDFHKFLQYKFFRQWEALRAYAGEKGIRIIGDVPIYVPLDSADVWANTGLFLLDENCRTRLVAGCPPDSFSADGQLWGNPLYDWQRMKESGYAWWIKRLSAAAGMYDVVRFDHFRGFESYWAVPSGDKNAIGGSWQPGPGMDFISAVQRALPELDFIAEDLGYLTDEVRALQEQSGYPGMKVMLFAFDSREDGNYLPHSYPVNSVCYSGTHDNLTAGQWFDEALPEDVKKAKAYLGLNQEEGFVWGFIRACMSSVSKLCVIQMQDYLELGGFARMNFPGTLSNKNWTWRAERGFASEALAKRIRSVTEMYERI